VSLAAGICSISDLSKPVRDLTNISLAIERWFSSARTPFANMRLTDFDATVRFGGEDMSTGRDEHVLGI
jgi:hypothetical protein